MSEKLTGVGLRTYYEKLERKDRVRLKNYTALLFGIGAEVVANRYAGRREFSNAELLAMQPVIEKELWRQ